MNKKLLICICILFVSCAALAQSFESATDAVKNMGLGWNLGNTLDAHNQTITDFNVDGYWGQQGLESETCWGQPKATREFIHMMKEAGFGAIRVPVTWYNHLDKDGNVNAEWMARVKDVVDYVINENLYCIINVHHDTGSDSGNEQGKLTGAHWIHASGTNFSNNKERYEYLWKQIAETFKEYDQKLLFESYNEMLDTVYTKRTDDNGNLIGFSWGSWCYASFNSPNSYDEAKATDAYKAINDYAKSFVDVVRASGGNNAQRNLIVNTYAAANGAGTWNTHLKEPLTELTIPSGEKNHIAVEVHAYPSIVNGSTDKTITTIKSETKELMDGLNTNFVSKGIPVIIGEWGTSNVDAAETDYDARKSLMFQFCEDFVAQAKALNIASFYWMGLSDGSARNLPAFNQADLAETLAKAYHGSDYKGKYPKVEDFQIVYVVTYDKEWGELFLFGSWDRKAVNLSNYKGIRVKTDEIYGDKLQIKVYGDKDGKDAQGNDKFKEQYVQLSDASTTTTVDFDASILGSTFWGVTLQTNSGPMTAKVLEATLIKADGTEEPATIVSAWGCTVVAETPTGISEVYTITPSNNAIYNLQGQRINTPKKGIYIRNGKKYIAK